MTGPRAHNLGQTVLRDEVNTELRRRKKKDVYKSISGSTKQLIAEKVKLEEADGWRAVRKNKKSTRMARPKPPDRQFEDEVWCILAQMGFDELSKGRQFTITVQDDLPPRQIDVFAKDDETAIVVECTRRNTPGRKSMTPLIDKIQAMRPGLLKSIHSAYGRHPKLKLKPIIATRNIEWSEEDRERCRVGSIGILTDGELDYYLELVRHLKQAARYQFLAHMFGGQKIDGLARTVRATQGKMGGDTFYTFLIRPDDLLKTAYVGHKASRDVEDLTTYQRMLQPTRLKAIAKYINDGGKFPTNVVVNLKTPKGSSLRFEPKGKQGNEAWGTLHLPPIYASAWIIDGQHRLYGYVYARDAGGFTDDSTALTVLAYDNLPAEKEMNLFIDINSKQVKVRASLLGELYADLHWGSSDQGEALQALHARIASRLNSIKTSPLHERMVVTGKRKTPHRCLTLTSIQKGLEKANLLATTRRGLVVPGPLSTVNSTDYNGNLKKSLAVLADCLRLFQSGLTTHWELGDAPGGYLCTNLGIRSLFYVIRDITEHVTQKDGTDFSLLSARETSACILPFLEVLVEHFTGATTEEYEAFRGIGSSLAGVRKQANELEALIHKALPEFGPTELLKYLESRDEEGTKQADGNVRRIHGMLYVYVIQALKQHHGDEGDVWWTEGVPYNIRRRCAIAYEEKNRDGAIEQNLFLVDYINICIQNWSVVKDVVSLDAKDKENKRANTKWIKKLNDIRRITAHPERGVLDTDQVAFVTDCLAKVQRYFPASAQYGEGDGR